MVRGCNAWCCLFVLRLSKPRELAPVPGGCVADTAGLRTFWRPPTIMRSYFYGFFFDRCDVIFWRGSPKSIICPMCLCLLRPRLALFLWILVPPGVCFVLIYFVGHPPKSSGTHRSLQTNPDPGLYFLSISALCGTLLYQYLPAGCIVHLVVTKI